jgi:hypothetical protein
MRIGIVAAWVLTVAAAARTADAQSSTPTAPKVEVWAGMSAAGRAPAGRLVTTYAPPLLPAGEFSSRGGQTLTLDRRRALGFEGGVNLFARPHVGVQIMASRSAVDLSGANGPYRLDMTYVSRQPPDSTPQTFSVHESIPWPDTTGSLSLFTAALNGVVRLGGTDHPSVTAAAGLTYGRIGGTVEQVGYTTFRMGGHAVLFSDEYRLAISLGGASVVGVNAGGELTMPVHRRTAILIGYRFFAAPPIDAPVQVKSILNANEVTNEETIASVSPRLPLAPVRLDVSGWRVLAGVKIAF